VPESFACIVEIPKGSRNKHEFDHERHVIKLDRFLFASVVYPSDTASSRRPSHSTAPRST
jgi:inorganic pyrophosphatase